MGSILKILFLKANTTTRNHNKPLVARDAPTKETSEET
jgi:hypothetical protein